MEETRMNNNYFYTRDAMFEKIEDINTSFLLSKDSKSNGGNKTFTYFNLNQKKGLKEVMKSNNNLYEILPPETSTKVKLYFDLEMEGEEFDTAYCYERLSDFIEWIAMEIEKLFDILLLTEDLIILDSCRDNKLSFHVIVNNKMCFNNVSDMKIFIMYLKNRFNNPMNEIEEKLFKILSYYTNKGAKRFIFDCLPYSSHQNFRLINQSKMGKKYTLKDVSPVKKWNLEDTLIRIYDKNNKRKIIETKTLEQLYDKFNNDVKDEHKKKKQKTTTSTSTSTTFSSENEKNVYEFQSNGLTLFEKKGITDEKLNEMNEWKHALYLIPNTYQPYEVYRNIAMAVKFCGGTKTDYLEWFELSDKYNKKDSPLIKSFDTFRTKSKNDKNQEKSFGLPYLRRIAKQCHPEKYQTSQHCLKTFFELDTDGLKVIKEDCQFVSMEGTKHENNIMDENKLLILHAYLGRGKTTAIKRLLHQYDSYLFISPRQTFANFIASDFNCDCYLNVEGDFNREKFVVSVESMWKLTIEQYDVIVLDESESILNQFSSHTMNGRQLEIWNILENLVKNAKKVIMADAFLSNRTLDIAKHFVPDSITLIQNNTAPIKRIAREINSNLFCTELLAELQQGNKPYVCYSSATKLIEHCNKLEGAGFVDKKIKEIMDNALIYHSKTDDAIFKTMKNINKTWHDAKMVVTSPTNTIGCSYAREEIDFDKVWINAYPTCCVRDTFQTQMRVRHLKQNEMTFCLPNEKALNFGKSRYRKQFKLFDDYNDYNKEKEYLILKTIDELIDERKREDENDKCQDLKNIRDCYEENDKTPDVLKHLYYCNLQEQTLSTIYYKEMFYVYLDKCGYVLQQNMRKKNENEKDDDDLDMSFDDGQLYENIVTVNKQEAEHLQYLVERKNATSFQKLQLSKHFFDSIINTEIEETIKSELFHNIYEKSHNKHIIDNLYLEMKKGIKKGLYKDFNSSGSGFEMNQMTSIKLKYINEINTMLGFENSLAQNSTVITREKIENCIDYMKTERTNILNTFGIDDMRKKKDDDYGMTLGLIKLVYKRWCGTDFNSQNKKKKSQAYNIKNDITKLINNQQLF